MYRIPEFSNGSLWAKFGQHEGFFTTLVRKKNQSFSNALITKAKEINAEVCHAFYDF